MVKPRQKVLVLNLTHQKLQLSILLFIMLPRFLKKGVFLISTLRCKKCPFKTQTPSLECRSCGYLLDPEESLQGVNYFELYKIPINYDIQKEAVIQKFKEYQKRYHPDKFSAHDETLGQYSTSLSSAVTQGKQMLLDDIKRATYILSLRGIQLPGDGNKTQPINDPELIQQIFQIQSSINESNSKQQLEVEMSKANKKLDQFKKQFGKNYIIRQYQQCKDLLAKMKYYQQILFAIEDKLNKIPK